MYGDQSGEFVCESWGLVEVRQRIKFLLRITYDIIITIAFQMENMQTCYSSKFKRYSISVG